MSRLRPAVLTVALGVILAAPAAASATITAPCRAPGRMLTADRTTAVTRQAVEDDTDAFWACTRGHRARRIDRYGDLQDASVERGLVAWTVDYQQQSASSGPPYGYVRTLDLRTGRRVSHVVPDPASRSASTIRLAADGIAYYVAFFDANNTTPSTPPLPSVVEVHRLDRQGGDVTVGSGPSVEAGSLAVSPLGAFWLDAGQPRFSPISQTAPTP